MENFKFDEKIEEYSVPDILTNNIKKILSTKIIIDTDINYELADYFVNKGGILDVLVKEKMNWIDWKQLKESCKSASSMTIENNGILMEFLSQNYLSYFFNIKSLIYYERVSYESPENGNDLLFFDDNGNVYIFEVKSKISSNFSHTYLKEKIKNAYTSLFCSKEMKNHEKLAIARDSIDGIKLDDSFKDKVFDILERIEDVKGEFIDLCNEENIILNICIIGNGFNYTEEQIKDDLIDLIFKSVYCKSNCPYKYKQKCIIEKLKKSIILNIVSIEFNSDLNISLLNDNIVKIIDEKGLDKRC